MGMYVGCRQSLSRSTLLLLAAICIFVCQTNFVFSFVTNTPAFLRCDHDRQLQGQWRQPCSNGLFVSSSDTASLPEISTMRVAALKAELESYGISTRAMLEKNELVAAVEDARAKGLKPKAQSAKQATTSSSSSSASTSSSNTSVDSNKSRNEQLKEEIANCQAMKASELKQECKEYGINVAAFLEKNDYVQAVAQARVDGTPKKGSSDEEGYAEYADVEVLTDDSAGPRVKGQQTQQSVQSSPFAGEASPFGGGMGGMGNIADILKNMGMGGMGGANPFGGGGGAGNPFGGVNPFGGDGMGDAMGRAQELMKNPKVMEIIQKAQSNPRIMSKVNECMSNPASFAKYQNDPEVAELITELRKYM